MRSILPLSLLLLLTSCAYEPSNFGDARCDAPCFEGRGAAGVGICTTGRWKCEEGVFVDICEGAVYGHDEGEGCDNLDNDCDGEADNTAICRPNVCIPSEELCDGADNDCNGRTDDIPSLPCYPISEEFLRPGTPCRRGYYACNGGEGKVCTSAVVPVAEVCDGQDNDCDGWTDNWLGMEWRPVDIVLVVDRSGSMAEELTWLFPTLQAALKTHYYHPFFRFALVYTPGPDASFELVSNFAEPNDFWYVLEAARAEKRAGCCDEYIYDAVWDFANYRTDLGWTPGTDRYVVWFGDENGQSARGLGEWDSIPALKAESMHFLAVVSPFEASTYADLAFYTSGGLFDLSGPGVQLALEFPLRGRATVCPPER